MFPFTPESILLNVCIVELEGIILSNTNVNHRLKTLLQKSSMFYYIRTSKEVLCIKSLDSCKFFHCRSSSYFYLFCDSICINILFSIYVNICCKISNCEDGLINNVCTIPTKIDNIKRAVVLWVRLSVRQSQPFSNKILKKSIRKWE